MSIPPAPTNLVWEIDEAGTSVTFRWTNPSPQPGDVYWVTVTSPGDYLPQRVSVPSVTLPFKQEAKYLSIEVRIVRSGQSSDVTPGWAER